MGREKFREPTKTEKIACVNKLLGGKYCEVFLCNNEGTYEILQCRIPGKFSKNKKKNLLIVGGFVLVDFHDYLSNKKSCEIVEIYDEHYRNHIELTYKKLAIAYNEQFDSRKQHTNDIVEFTNDEIDEHPSMMQKIPNSIMNEELDGDFFDDI